MQGGAYMIVLGEFECKKSKTKFSCILYTDHCTLTVYTDHVLLHVLEHSVNIPCVRLALDI